MLILVLIILPLFCLGCSDNERTEAREVEVSTSGDNSPVVTCAKGSVVIIDGKVIEGTSSECPPGASIKQSTTGNNSPAVIGGGDVKIETKSSR